MGWSGGPPLADNVYELMINQGSLSEDDKTLLARALYEEFNILDADDWSDTLIWQRLIKVGYLPSDLLEEE